MSALQNDNQPQLANSVENLKDNLLENNIQNSIQTSAQSQNQFQNGTRYGQSKMSNYNNSTAGRDMYDEQIMGNYSRNNMNYGSPSNMGGGPFNQSPSNMRNNDWDSEIIVITNHDRMFETVHKEIYKTFDFKLILILQILQSTIK